MKRGKPMKRTPLKRGNSSLKRSPLSYRSSKQEEKYVERRKLVSDLLSQRPYCEACVIFYVFDTIQNSPPFEGPPPMGVVKVNKSKDIHELVNRSQGGSILEKDNLLAVCRPCHNRITTEPKLAEKLGLHLEGWCNNRNGFSEAERVRYGWKNGTPSQPYWYSL